MLTCRSIMHIFCGYAPLSWMQRTALWFFYFFFYYVPTCTTFSASIEINVMHLSFDFFVIVMFIRIPETAIFNERCHFLVFNITFTGITVFSLFYLIPLFSVLNLKNPLKRIKSINFDSIFAFPSFSWGVFII